MKAGTGFLDGDITKRFSERIGESLGRDPVTLAPATHREKLKALMESLGEMSFYQLLDVKPAAGEEEIHQAYSELARIVHPSHAKTLGMAGSQAALELMFERATEAYLTLNDPDRSRVYQMATGIKPAQDVKPNAEQRRAEQVAQGERLYKVAKGLNAEARYYDAVQTLRQAVQLDPRAEYYSLLGECLSYNPNWLKEAVKAYESAAELAPHDPNIRSQLGLMLERSGTLARAADQYRAAIALDPDSADAEAGLQRFKALRRDASRQEHPLAKLKRFFNGILKRGGSG